MLLLSFHSFFFFVVFCSCPSLLLTPLLLCSFSVSFVFLTFLSLPSFSFAVAALSWPFLPSLFIFVFIVLSLYHLFCLLSLLYFFLLLLPSPCLYLLLLFIFSFSSSSSVVLFIVRLWLCFYFLLLDPFFILYPPPHPFFHFVLENQGQIVRSGGSLRRQSSPEEVFGICNHVLNVSLLRLGRAGTRYLSPNQSRRVIVHTKTKFRSPQFLLLAQCRGRITSSEVEPL